MGKLSVVAMSTPESDVAKKPGAEETPADESTAGLVNESILYFVGFTLNRISGLFTNSLSRFASVVFNAFLGPTRQVQCT